MTVGVVKCEFRYKVVILIRKDPSPGNIHRMLNIPLYLSCYNEVWLYQYFKGDSNPNIKYALSERAP